MTSHLVGASSVHVVAAAADYLEPRTSLDDEVVVVGVDETGVNQPEVEGRDVDDALNVAGARFVEPTPTIDRREGEPIGELREAITEHDPSIVVIGANAGVTGASGIGSTTRALLEAADRPVVVVPLPDLS